MENITECYKNLRQSGALHCDLVHDENMIAASPARLLSD